MTNALHSRRTRWVLTLSDDSRLRETLTRGLNRHDFEVVAVSTASDLALLSPPAGSDQAEIDAVLVDIPAGPEPRAMATLRRIQELRADLPTLCLVSGRDSAAVSGMKNTLALLKPIDLAELASELSRVTRVASED